MPFDFEALARSMRILSTIALFLCSSALAAPNGPWQEVVAGELAVDSGDTAAGERGEGRFGRTPQQLCSTQVLHSGIQIPSQPELYHVRNPSEAWGTPELVEAIVLASEDVAWQLPGADPILIGDLSRQRGGYLPPHKSHRSGLDADIGIFTTGARQSPVSGFVGITPDNLDYEANWIFWRSLLETGLVERILLDQSLIDAMRAWTVESGNLSAAQAEEIFPPAGTPRLWEKRGVFQHVAGHRDHIHVRALCGDEVPREQG